MNSELITILALRPFKWALICSIWTTGTQVMLVKVFFFGKGPGQGQIPGLLGHGPQIPDRTIDHCKATDLCSKFQLSRCYSGWEIGDRQTDGRTDGRTDGQTDGRTDGQTDGRHNDFSRAHFYKPFYAFDRFKLRDVYFSLWGNRLVHSYLRFQATDFHKFGLVGKALAYRWFLAHVWP
jgi:hypothetical protein